MNIKYRPEIDGLRAIAVALVVIYHAFPSVLPGGFIGVDVFFVISGFLITSILKREVETGKYSIKEFYRRRIDRIFPALLVVMFSVYAFGWFTLFADEFMQLGKQIAGGAGFIANIVLYSETGYFNATSITKPFLHLWSLGIEEQFYLLFPIILYVAYKKKWNFTLLISVLAIISFALNIYSIQTNVEKTFYLPQYRFWELLLGSLLAVISHGEKEKLPRKSVANVVSALAVVALLEAALLLNADMAFPGWYALIPVIASVALIWSSRAAGPVNYILSSKPFVFVGLISYPLYLWHWPLLSLAYVINGTTTPEWVNAWLVALAIVLSVITYLLIERPLKRIKSWNIKTIPLLVMMAAIGFAGLTAYLKEGIDSRSNIQVSKEVSRQLNGDLWPFGKNEACLEKYDIPQAKTLPWWFCMIKRDADPEVLLLGNSYANHLYPGISFNKKIKDFNVLQIGTIDVTLGVLDPTDPILHAQMEYVDNIIKTTKSIKYIIISGIDPKADDHYIDALLKRMEIITSNGAKVIIFYPHVRLADDIKACFSRPLKHAAQSCTSDLTEFNDIHSHIDHMRDRIKEKYPDTLFFDVNEAFCDKDGCSSVQDGLPMYRDQYKHFSEHGSERVGEKFADWAKENLPGILK